VRGAVARPEVFFECTGRVVPFVVVKVVVHELEDYGVK
jgi:hypothetical protein